MSHSDSPDENDSAQKVHLPDIEPPYPEVLPLFPISNRPLFPGLVVPLIYEGQEYTELIRRMAEKHQQYVALVLVHDDQAGPSPDNFHRVGVLGRLLKATSEEHQQLHLIVECLQRLRITEFVRTEVPFTVRVQHEEKSESPNSIELRAYSVAMINTIKELLKHNPLYEEELKLFLRRYRSDQPGMLADFAASLTSADAEELQDILETFSLFERVKKVLALLDKEVNVSRLQSRIRKNINERVAEQQRKFFLREQLEEIRRELGLNEDPVEKEIARLKERAASCRFSEEARERFEEELHKLSSIEPSSPEYGLTRSYLDWLCSLPWGRHGRDRFDLRRAARELNRDHAGLEDIKDRILELIAVGGRRKDIGGSIILFVGPPGVGKTSIGRAIAAALNRPFYRFSVGGMRDEAEIKGHRRTYIGAMPGKVIQALKHVGADNPVIMIDEVDKIGSDIRGDPASALLEVLDPEQSKDFLDHYLDVRFDLSHVLFLLTANDFWRIPDALRNRAEVIRLPGYMAEEKRRIATRHLWPRLLKKNAFERRELQLTAAALREVIESYSREPGVRRLEQNLERIQQKIARQVAEGKLALPLRIHKKDLPSLLGKPRFTEEAMETGVGTALGMAWTANGGTLLTIECIVIQRDRRLLKTSGQLGKVMEESSGISMSFILANAERYGVEKGYFDKLGIHLHVPEGATPKDGPSAGITMASALLSLALNRPPRRMAMTGELTLTGRVLAIGGLREKLLAAKRMHVHEVIVPVANEADLAELPADVCKGMTIHRVRHYDQVKDILFP